jgi:hypothetical protein
MAGNPPDRDSAVESSTGLDALVPFQVNHPRHHDPTNSDFSALWLKTLDEKKLERY